MRIQPQTKSQLQFIFILFYFNFVYLVFGRLYSSSLEARGRAAKYAIFGLGLYVGNRGRGKVEIRECGEMIKRWERGKFWGKGI